MTDRNNRIRQDIKVEPDIDTSPVSFQSQDGSRKNIPAYSGDASVEINGNVPYFEENDKTTVAFEKYSDLDELGRCGTAYACLGTETMPTEPRRNIGSVKPSGWHTVKYAGVNGNYLFH